MSSSQFIVISYRGVAGQRGIEQPRFSAASGLSLLLSERL